MDRVPKSDGAFEPWYFDFVRYYSIHIITTELAASAACLLRRFGVYLM